MRRFGPVWFGRARRRPPEGVASSFHLFWEHDEAHVVAAAATVEVVVPPSVDELYFWALQVSFRNPARQTGGAHIGLQYHPGYPDRGAVNWGGYDDVVGGTLEGSVSELPSALGNPNTRTYHWSAARTYRYLVSRSETGWWRGQVMDTTSGEVTTIRELNGHDADRLGGLMVWSEVFAPCDAPRVAVRWTDLEYTTVDGKHRSPRSLVVNYQAHSNHGCANTSSRSDREGVLQETGVERTTAQGVRLPWSPSQEGLSD